MEVLQSHTTSAVSYRAVNVVSHQRGRPRFEITKEQLLFLSSLSFTWSDIASLLGVSRMTIYRRRQEYDLLEDPQHVLDDGELDIVLRDMRMQHPEMGTIMALGSLRSVGYEVSRKRIRSAMR